LSFIGYSPKTNQYGLAIDTITAFELVQPNGNIITVTEQSHSDLFFGLKGGFNNFVHYPFLWKKSFTQSLGQGIVTQFTMKTFPQTVVWGGVIGYDATQYKSLKAAFTDFTSKDRDPKASILTAFTSTSSSVSVFFSPCNSSLGSHAHVVGMIRSLLAKFCSMMGQAHQRAFSISS
jgi:hypothetical protein